MGLWNASAFNVIREARAVFLWSVAGIRNETKQYSAHGRSTSGDIKAQRDETWWWDEYFLRASGRVVCCHHITTAQIYSVDHIQATE